MFLIDLEKSLEWYYKDDWKHVKKRIVFIFDNASIHLDDRVNHFFKKWGYLAFTLPQYTPWFNPIELMFKLVKKSVQTCNLTNRLLEYVAIKYLWELDERLLHKTVKSNISREFNVDHEVD